MKKQGLKELCLEVTNTCPMRCVHCSADAGLPLNDELNLIEIKKVIRKFKRLGGEILEISGGEPLCHSSILEIIRYAKEQGVEVRLYTSGFPLNDGIINKLLALKLDKVIFNLQGPNSKIHENITQTYGSFDRVMEGIKKLRSANQWVGVHFVPMKPNFSSLEKTVQLCSNLGVSEFAVLRFVPQGRGLENLQRLELSNMEFETLINEIVRIRNRFRDKIEIRVGSPLNFCHFTDNSIPYQECKAGKSLCLIKPNGDVAPCSAFKQNKEGVVGNIKTKSLVEIWRNSQLFNQLRYFDYEKLKGECSGCSVLSKCQGGCLAQRVLANDSIYQEPDPACPRVQFGLKIEQEQVHSEVISEHI